MVTEPIFLPEGDPGLSEMVHIAQGGELAVRDKCRVEPVVKQTPWGPAYAVPGPGQFYRLYDGERVHRHVSDVDQATPPLPVTWCHAGRKREEDRSCKVDLPDPQCWEEQARVDVESYERYYAHARDEFLKASTYRATARAHAAVRAADEACTELRELERLAHRQAFINATDVRDQVQVMPVRRRSQERQLSRVHQPRKRRPSLQVAEPTEPTWVRDPVYRLTAKPFVSAFGVVADLTSDIVGMGAGAVEPLVGTSSPYLETPYPIDRLLPYKHPDVLSSAVDAGHRVTVKPVVGAFSVVGEWWKDVALVGRDYVGQPLMDSLGPSADEPSRLRMFRIDSEEHNLPHDFAYDFGPSSRARQRRCEGGAWATEPFHRTPHAGWGPVAQIQCPSLAAAGFAQGYHQGFSEGCRHGMTGMPPTRC